MVVACDFDMDEASVVSLSNTLAGKDEDGI